jgi:hypothetical protein
VKSNATAVTTTTTKMNVDPMPGSLPVPPHPDVNEL